MKAVRALTRLAFVHRQAPLLASRGAHDHAHDHHESHNPGPPVTYDYIPGIILLNYYVTIIQPTLFFSSISKISNCLW